MKKQKRSNVPWRTSALKNSLLATSRPAGGDAAPPRNVPGTVSIAKVRGVAMAGKR